jgi:hypothetical protein
MITVYYTTIKLIRTVVTVLFDVTSALYRNALSTNTLPFIYITFYPICNEDYIYRFRFMVFNDTFNNISVISWRSVLLMDEIGEPGENHRPVASH